MQSQPIGPEWNSLTQFKDNIKPKVITQAGQVITPAKLPKKMENSKNNKERVWRWDVYIMILSNANILFELWSYKSCAVEVVFPGCVDIEFGLWIHLGVDLLPVCLLYKVSAPSPRTVLFPRSQVTVAWVMVGLLLSIWIANVRSPRHSRRG